MWMHGTWIALLLLIVFLQLLCAANTNTETQDITLQDLQGPLISESQVTEQTFSVLLKYTILLNFK